MCVRFLPCIGYCLQQACTTDCESCTWLISTNAWSTEVSTLGRKRGTCYVARRLELAAVALLLWVSVAILLRFLKGTGFFRLCLPTRRLWDGPTSFSLFTSSNYNCLSLCRFVVHRTSGPRRSQLTAVYGQAHTRRG